MRKTMILFAVVLLILFQGGCAKKNNNSNTVLPAVPAATTDASKQTEDLPETVAVPQMTKESEPETTAEGEEELAEPDIDLTVFSNTVIYSEIYNMLVTPEQYVGKSIRMRGLFLPLEGENGKYSFACVVMDATACCLQGLEFFPAGEFSYPEDFPQEGEEITVSGIFEIENINGSNYCFLRDAVFK